MDYATLQNDPTFMSLPFEEKQKALAMIDPSFRSLAPEEQAKGLSQLFPPSVAERARTRLSGQGVTPEQVKAGGGPQAESQWQTLPHELGIATSPQEGLQNIGRIGSTAARTVGGVLAGTAKLAAGALMPPSIPEIGYQNPAESTIRDMAAAQVRSAHSASQSAQQGDIPGVIGHSIAAAVPIVGPAAESVATKLATPQTPEAIGEGLGYAVAPKIADEAGGLAGRAMQGGIEAVGNMRTKALADYNRAMNVDPLQATIGQRMMSEGIRPTKESLKQIDERLTVANKDLADAKADNADAVINPGSLIRQLQGIKNDYRTGNGVPTSTRAESAINLIDDLSKRVAQATTPGKGLTVEDALDFRRDWQDKANAGGAFDPQKYPGLDPNTAAIVHKRAANELNDLLHRTAPDVAKADAEVSYLLNAQKIASDVTPPDLQPAQVGSRVYEAVRHPAAFGARVGANAVLGPNAVAGRALLRERVGQALGVDTPPGPSDLFSPHLAADVSALQEQKALPPGNPPPSPLLLREAPSDAMIRDAENYGINFRPGGTDTPMGYRGAAPDSFSGPLTERLPMDAVAGRLGSPHLPMSAEPASPVQPPPSQAVIDAVTPNATTRGLPGMAPEPPWLTRMKDTTASNIAALRQMDQMLALNRQRRARLAQEYLDSLSSGPDAAKATGQSVARSPLFSVLSQAVRNRFANAMRGNDLSGVRTIADQVVGGNNLDDPFGHDEAVHGAVSDAMEQANRNPDMARQILLGKGATYVNPDGTEVPVPTAVLRAFVGSLK